jgi:hypothetical protein
MDIPGPEGSHPNGKVYVKFGPLPTQEMPREWAEEMLSLWKEKKPVEFGKYLAEVITRGG